MKSGYQSFFDSLGVVGSDVFIDKVILDPSLLVYEEVYGDLEGFSSNLGCEVYYPGSLDRLGLVDDVGLFLEFYRGRRSDVMDVDLFVDRVGDLGFEGYSWRDGYRELPGHLFRYFRDLRGLEFEVGLVGDVFLDLFVFLCNGGFLFGRLLKVFNRFGEVLPIFDLRFDVPGVFRDGVGGVEKYVGDVRYVGFLSVTSSVFSGVGPMVSCPSLVLLEV
ncbi:putative nucleotidyltransferase [Methanonatronarchaeum thermophilum]|uniref:Putative nucleotidyltransferase n=1 Tax=Methanonatronarchaeum thermophilum TaxID=1927129 RepID=A0A1Y3GB10_9EURY|nr:hypothetical protein [Methanonatronarchaeum thermophilum]OUJ18430.1 putative nucleotidyltransferase [Methanonatronarchaeum thermophilum]